MGHDTGMTFVNRCVIVTGAGSGIGRAIASGFCADGARVVGIGRTAEDLETTAGLCPAGKMHFVVGDVARAEDVSRLFCEALRLHGKVDILVNNAALYPKVAFLASTPDEWSRVIQTNVIGMALCCHAALPGMLDRGFGRILNLGSFAWRGPIANSSAYSASKGAVGPFTKALATEIDQSRYPDVLVSNLVFMVGRWADLIMTVRFPKVLGMFVLGLWAVRTGIALEPRNHRDILKRWSLIGLAGCTACRRRWPGAG